jgi:hypothetical protein
MNLVIFFFFAENIVEKIVENIKVFSKNLLFLFLESSEGEEIYSSSLNQSFQRKFFNIKIIRGDERLIFWLRDIKINIILMSRTRNTRIVSSYKHFTI